MRNRNLPKQHARVAIVKAAEAELRKCIMSLAAALTDAEYIQVVNRVCSDSIATWAKYAIRDERHGDTDTPGDIA